MGLLADLFGPRRVYLFSLCVVTVAGAGAIAASSGRLIAVRVLLGIGTSGPIRLRCAFSARRLTVLVRTRRVSPWAYCRLPGPRRLPLGLCLA